MVKLLVGEIFDFTVVGVSLSFLNVDFVMVIIFTIVLGVFWH